MAITTLNGIVAALGNSAVTWPINKASVPNAAAGQFFSTWLATGSPGFPGIPTTVAVPTNSTAGALTFTNPPGGQSTYIGRAMLMSANTGTDIQFHDRLSHCGGLSGTVTTAQTANVDVSVSTSNMVLRKGATDYSEVQWWIEIYVGLGATGVNATPSVTLDDDTTLNAAAIALGANPRSGRLYPIQSPTAGRYIKRVNSVTLSATTGTAGDFGVVATRPLGGISLGLANSGIIADWATLGLPKVNDSASLFMVVIPTTTTTGTIYGSVKLIQG